MGWIKTGSVTVTNGSATVTGSGTFFVDVGTCNAGDIFCGPDGKQYEILSVVSNTGLTLASNYLGTSLGGQAYAIYPIGLLPSTLAQQVKATLTTANNALASTVRYDINSMGLTLTQQQNARTNIAALSAFDVGNGYLSKSVAGGVDVTLTAAEASASQITLTGALTANINLIVPAAVRTFLIANGTTGAFTITVKTPAGAGIIAKQGNRSILICDGSTVVNPLDSITGNLSIAGSLSLINGGNATTISSAATSTAYNQLLVSNTGGTSIFGVDNSAGTAYGGSAYATIVGSAGTTNLEFLTAGVVRGSFDTAGKLTIGVGNGSVDIQGSSNTLTIRGGSTSVNITSGTPQQTNYINTSSTVNSYFQHTYINSSGGIMFSTGAQQTSATGSYNQGKWFFEAATVSQPTTFVIDGTTGFTYCGYSGSNGAYRLQVNGQIFATSATIATSDGRFKENVESLDDALSIVMALRPVSFNWKAHNVHNFNTADTNVGFIAQEVAAVLADKPFLNSLVKANRCTSYDEIEQKYLDEEFIGLAESNLISILTRAIQQQQATIASMTPRIATLEAVALH